MDQALWYLLSVRLESLQHLQAPLLWKPADIWFWHIVIV